MRPAGVVTALVVVGLMGCAGLRREEVVMPAPAPRAVERDPGRPAPAPDQRLTEQVTRIAAELSELQNAVARLIVASRDQEGQLRALQRRLSELAPHLRDGVGGAPRGLALSPRSGAAGGEAAGSAGTTPTVATPEDLYQAGLAKFRSRDLDGAVLIFYELLANHPTHPRREAAQFLVADIYYSQKDLRGALAEFEGLLAALPNGAKLPDTLLKIGLCHRGLGDETEAQKTWQRIIREHPNTPAARQARVLLRSRGSGRTRPARRRPGGSPPRPPAG